jgi:hypothetical protein
MKTKWKITITVAILCGIGATFYIGYRTGTKYTYASAVQSECTVLWLNASLIRDEVPEKALQFNESAMFGQAFNLYKCKDLPFLSTDRRTAIDNVLTKVASHLDEYTDRLDERAPKYTSGNNMRTNAVARLQSETSISTKEAQRAAQMFTELTVPLMNAYEERMAKARSALRSYIPEHNEGQQKSGR